MHGWALMLVCRLCWPALQHAGLVATKGSAEDGPMPRWPETPLHSLLPAALKDTQAEMLQGYRELLAYLPSLTFCISRG